MAATEVTSITDRMRDAIGQAVLAPSSHNTQPWLFRLRDDALDVIADRTRALPVNDPHDRELTISCGAALLNARVAFASMGLGVRVEPLPDAADRDLLATIRTTTDEPDHALAALRPAIAVRRTVCASFEGADLPAGLVAELTAAAEAEGAAFVHEFDDADREDLLRLVAAGDRIQFEDESWRRELACWMQPRRTGAGHAVPALALPVTRFVVSHLDMGIRAGTRDVALGTHSSLLGVLATSQDGVAAWLAAGQALERLLLVAARQGIQASYLNQPCQVESLRPRLAELVKRGAPQLVIRLGHPRGHVPATPRRPLDAVVVEHPLT